MDKQEIFWAASLSVKADPMAMAALKVVEKRVGMDSLYNRLQDGDLFQIATWLQECEGFNGPPLTSNVEKELNGVLNIYAERGSDSYRLADIGGELQLLRCETTAKPVRKEAMEQLVKTIEGFDTTVAGEPLLESVYRKALAEADGPAMYGVADGLERDVEAAFEDLSAPTKKTIVREKVIVKETKPYLEGLFQEAIAKALVGISLDEVQETIKKRLIDDFGFEPIRHTVIQRDQEHEVSGIVHEKFDEVLHYVSNDIPTYLFGAAGSGKGYLGRQVAEALGLDYHFMTSVTDEFKINGFIDAYGTYHETPFYRAFKNGGVFFLDELDASAPEVLVCLNIAIADKMYTFPHESIKAHPDFRVIAAGNTLSTGADATYVGRMQLDTASLNRFVNVKVGYDPKIDMFCAEQDQELVDFIHEFRKVVESTGLPIVASYRNIVQIKVGEAKLPLEDVLASCLTKEMNQDDLNIVSEKMQLGGNRYLQALKNVKSQVG